MVKKVQLILLVVLTLMVVLAGCGTNSNEGGSTGSQTTGAAASGNQTPDNSAGETAAELQKVKIAVLPYFDYTLFVAAKELGVDREQGIDLELIPFTNESQAVQALLNGSIDVAQGALGSFVPLLPNASELRVVLNNNQFKGFVYIGREGELKSFNQFLEEGNNDFATAQKATMEQLKDKTFMMVESSFSGMLSSALENVGMGYGDIKVMNFQNDAQAATAFLRGEGDLYTGSLPQQMKILKQPGYIAIAGNEALGAAGLWFSNTAVTADYLNDHKDVVERLAAVHYRMTRYLQVKPEAALQPMIDYVKKNASSDLTMDDAKQMIADFVVFNTVEESGEGVYAADSPLYWKKAADLFVKQNESLGKIGAGSVKIDEVVQQEQIFKDLQGNQALMDWINSPIE
ncbi:ABC transporter substrate-binding protein [Paenibacillus sp. S150]|uniref:ABC transporter substrate-binding protein n=1 Tax=Paenibacillus sp. S150 TaxID=2749826 RepID=UPI001C576D9E|nr:ABC transporter substrate-binding protein [Paenibacillus sp. S150]MBW4083095.1 ABC transporter substrate-binding protein [Paenibacillus sp. S150]